MRLEWLEDLLAVAETGSFHEAATRRHLSPSAFSRRIAHIEDHLGVELFDRTRKPVQLHPGVSQQRDQMTKLAQDLRQLGADLRRGDRLAGNRITLASQHALTTALTPGILKAIHARHAGTHVRLRSANLDECFALLLSRQADIVLGYRLPDEPHPIGERFVETAVIGADDLIPLGAASQTVALTEGLSGGLSGGELPFIAYPAEVFLGRALERRILPDLRRRCHAVPRAETALTLAALELASVGVGVAWVPASLAKSRIMDGSLADLSSLLPSLRLEVTAARLFGEASPMAVAVWQVITEETVATAPEDDAQ